MFVSKSRGNQNFKSVELHTMEELTKLITSSNYSLSTFKGGDRRIVSFEQARAIGLDFDDGLSLDDALDLFKDHKHLIATTKSHQKEKNGVVADRFRVILFLDQPIVDAKDFKQTMKEVHTLYPQADPACKDPARYFYKSENVISINRKGKTEPVRKWVEPEAKPEVELSPGEKGKLLKATYELLAMGAKPGTANSALYNAAKDLQQNGYTKDEVVSLVTKMIEGGGTWGTKYVNETDLKTINSAFKSEPNDTPRVEENPFNFMPIGDLLKIKNNVSWAVDGLLMEGCMSIIVGPPKSGKSTLVRQLALSASRGTDFLGRKVKKGGVLYVAIEEHPGALKEQFKTIGVNRNDDILIHVGHLGGGDALTKLTEYALERKPALIVIDTLSLFGKFSDINDYETVNKTMHSIKKIARDTGTHLILVHHTRKSEVINTNAVMGSQAIFGSVDAAMFFSTVGDSRYISSSGRMTRNFESTELIFNKDTETYALGRQTGGKF